MSRRKSKKSWLALVVVFVCIALTLSGLAYYNRLRFSPKRDAKTYSSSELYCSIADDKYIESSAITSERYYSNEIIVYVKDRMEQVIDKVDNLYNCKIVGKNAFDLSFLVRFPDAQNYAQLTKRMNRIRQLDYVKKTSLNYALDIDSEATPVSSAWTKQSWQNRYTKVNWGMKAIQASYGWNYQKLMKTVKVGILDTGFDSSAADLKGRLEVIGENNKKAADHGSHVAGIIGASYDDSGVAGVASNVYMYGVAQSEHASIYSIMTNLHILNSRGCQVINLSIGSDELNFAASQGNTNAKNALRRMSRLLTYSIAKFKNPALLVCASGNGNAYRYVQVDNAFYGYKKLIRRGHNLGFIDDTGTFRMYNQKLYGEKLSEDCDVYWNLFTYIDDSKLDSKIIVVGSAGLKNKKYRLSKFSVSGTRVNVLAPGENIYSVKPSAKSGYGYLSGTSQAAAHVSGLAALLLSFKSDLKITELENDIINTANIATNDLPMINVKAALNTLFKDHPMTLTISGVVMDQKNKSLKKATVVTSAYGHQLASVKTDAQGRYTIKAELGQTTLKVKYPLYKTYQKKYTIYTKNQKIGTIRLNKDKWKQAYLSFIKKHKGTSYALWQVNDDQVPELMVFGEKHNYIVTYINKKLYSYDIGPRLISKNYRKKGNLIFVSYTKNDTLYECYYRIGTARITTVHTGTQKGNAYVWDGAPVSAANYAKNSQKMTDLLTATDHKEYNKSAIKKAIRNY